VEGQKKCLKDLKDHRDGNKFTIIKEAIAQRQFVLCEKIVEDHFHNVAASAKKCESLGACAEGFNNLKDSRRPWTLKDEEALDKNIEATLVTLADFEPNSKQGQHLKTFIESTKEYATSVRETITTEFVQKSAELVAQDASSSSVENGCRPCLAECKSAVARINSLTLYKHAVSHPVAKTIKVVNDAVKKCINELNDDIFVAEQCYAMFSESVKVAELFKGGDLNGSLAAFSSIESALDTLKDSAPPPLVQELEKALASLREKFNVKSMVVPKVESNCGMLQANLPN